MSLYIFAVGLIRGGRYQDEGSHVKEIANSCNLLDEVSTQFQNVKFASMKLVGTLRAQGLGRGSY
jgi:hypothetical protein